MYRALEFGDYPFEQGLGSEPNPDIGCTLPVSGEGSSVGVMPTSRRYACTYFGGLQNHTYCFSVTSDH